MSLEEITRKILSYCEIPSELTEKHWISENYPDSYVEYEVSLGSPAHSHIMSDLDKWIIDNYPELTNTKFLIHIDY